MRKKQSQLLLIILSIILKLPYHIAFDYKNDDIKFKQAFVNDDYQKQPQFSQESFTEEDDYIFDGDQLYDVKSVNANILQEHAFEDTTDQKRNLAVTCGSSTKYFPMIFGGDTTCTDAVYSQGMDADSSGNLYLAGYVTAASTSSCSVWTDGRSGTNAFLASLDQYGIVQWYSIATQNTLNAIVYYPKIKGSYLYTALSNSQDLRIAQVQQSDGVTIKEIRKDNWYDVYSTAIARVNVQADSYSNYIYVTLTIRSNEFSAYDATNTYYFGLILVFDTSLNFQYSWMTKASSGKSTIILIIHLGTVCWALDVATTSSKVVMLGQRNLYENFISYWSKSSPTTITYNFIFAPSTTTIGTPYGRVVMSSNGVRWFALIRHDTTGNPSLWSSDLGWNSLYQYNYFSIGTACLYFDIVLDSNNYPLIVHEYSCKISFYHNLTSCIAYMQFYKIVPGTTPGSTSIQYQYYVNKGSAINTFVDLSLVGSNLYVSWTKDQWQGTSYPRRIVLMKFDTSFSSFNQYNCYNTTTSGISIPTSPLYTYSLQSQYTSYQWYITTWTFTTLATASLQPTSQPIANYYVQRSMDSPYCALPYTVQDRTLYYDLATQDGVAVTYDMPVITSCDGRSYVSSTSTLTQIDGSTLQSYFTYSSTNQQFSLTLTASTHYILVGTYQFRCYFNLDGFILPTFFNLVVLPPTYTDDPSVPNHDVSTCNDKIYPIYIGQSNAVQLYRGSVDSYGNFLLVGQGNIQPYTNTLNTYRSFIALMDQRANYYWVYHFVNKISTTQAQCYYATEEFPYVYAVCNQQSSYYSTWTTCPVAVKLDYKTGYQIYKYFLHQDSTNYNSQQAEMIRYDGSNKVVALITYYTGSYYTFAIIRYDESTMTIDFYKIYQMLTFASTNTLYNRNFLLGTIYMYSFYSQGSTNGIVISRVKIDDGIPQAWMRVATSGNANSKVFPCYYSSDRIFLPSTQDLTPYQLYLALFYRTTFVFQRQSYLTFSTSVSIQQASGATDSAGNLYVHAGYGTQIFIKLDTSFNILAYRAWTGTSTFHSVGADYYSSSVFFFGSGTFISGDQTSFMIFRSDASLSFDTYQCYSMLTLTSSSNTYYPQSQTSSVPSITTTSLTSSTPNSGATPTTNIPYMAEAAGTEAYTTSYYATDDAYYLAQGQFSTTYLQAYPYSNLNYRCSSVDTLKTYSGDSTIEVTWQSGTQIVTLETPSPDTNCQGRPIGYQILNPNTLTTTMQFTWLTVTQSTLTVSINTNTPTSPQSFNLVVQYYDRAYQTSIKSYFNHIVQFRMVASTNITLSSSNIANCPQPPFPMSFGGTAGWFWSYSIAINSADGNLIVGGKSTNSTSQADNYDGYIMRLSTTGYIEWLSYTHLGLTYNEQVTGVDISNNYVYALFYVQNSETTNTNAIVKLTYQEGKKIWGRMLLCKDPLNAGYTVYYHSGYDLRIDTKNPQYLTFGQVIKSSAYYLPTYSTLQDDGTTLTSVFNYHFYTTSTQLASNCLIAYDPTSSYVFIGTLIHISSGSYPDYVVLKLNSLTGNIVWNKYYTYVGYGLRHYYGTIHYNTYSKYVYTTYMTTTTLVIVSKIDGTTGTTLAKFTYQINWGSYQFDLAMNNNNGNIILSYHLLDSYQILIYMDKDFASPVLASSREFYSPTGYGGRQIALSTNFFYVLGNFYRIYANSYPETGIFKYNYDYTNSMEYACHIFDFNIGGTPYIYNSYTAENNVLSSSYYYTTTGLVTIDHYNLRVVQIQKYQSTFYPQADSYNSWNSQSYIGGDSVACKANQDPSIAELPALEVTIGSSASMVLDSTVLKQCQGEGVKVTFKYENGATGSTLNNNFITYNSATSTLTVDLTSTTNSYIKAGFRPLQIYACNAIFTANCQTLSLMIIIWPASMNAATTTAQTRTTECDARTEWPKVIGDSTANSFVKSIDIDNDQGNMLLVGYAMSPALRPAIYSQAYWVVYIHLLNNLGDLQWAYSITFTAAQSMQSGKGIFGEDGYIYTLTYYSTALNLLKQEYAKGKVIWFRKIYGQYYDNGFHSLTQDPSTYYIYIASLRTDVNSGYYQDTIVKIDPTSNPPRQLWFTYVYSGQNVYYPAYDIMISPVSNYAISAGVMRILSGSYYPVNSLVRWDKDTGTYNTAVQQNPIRIPLTNTIQLSDGTIYTTYFHQTNNYYYIVKYSDSLVFQWSRYFSATSATTTELRQTVDEDRQILYIAFSQETNDWLWVGRFDISSTISSVDSVRLLDTSHQYDLAGIKYYNDNLYLAYTSKYYLSTTYKSAVLGKLGYDFSDSDSCILWTKATTVGLVTTSDIGNYNSQFTFKQVKQIMNLYPVSGVYAEIISDSRKYAFSAATYKGCTSPTPVFTTAYVNQYVTSGQSKSYTFYEPTVCNNQALTLTGSWSVDKYTTTPGFMSLVWVSGTGGTITLNPSSSDVGSYTVRIKYVDSTYGYTVQNTFLVDVVPNPAYTAATPTGVCASDIWPGNLGQQTNTIIKSGDVDSAGTTYIICGQTSNAIISTTTTYKSAFLQSYNSVWNINYDTSFDIGSIESYVLKCQFGDTGYIYSGIQSSATSGVYDQIFLMKQVASSGQIVNAKQIATTGYELLLDDFQVDTSNGDVYISGRHWKNTLLTQTTYKEGFIYKFSSSLTATFVRTYFYNYQLTEVRSLYLDSSNSHLYAIVSSVHGALLKSTYGPMQVSSSDGTPNWAKVVYSTYATLLVTQAGMAKDSTYFYTAIPFLTSGPTVSGNQMFVTKYTTSAGAVQAQIEMTLPAAPNGCDLLYESTSANLFLAIAYTSSGMHVVAISTSTFTSVTLIRLALNTGTNLKYYTPILSKAGSNIFLIVDYATSGSLSGAFFHRINDFTNLYWNGGCTVISQRDTSITATTYNEASYGINGNEVSYWLSVTVTSKDLGTTNPFSTFYSNPTYLKGSYYSTVGDLKTTYSTCYTIAAPDATTFASKWGSVLPDTGFLINGYTSNFTTSAFTQCQGYAVTMSATLSTGAALPTQIKYYPTTYDFEIAANNNNYVGNYTVKVIGTNAVQNTQSNSSTFVIEFQANQAPNIIEDFDLVEEIYAWHNYSHSFVFSYDSEGDLAYQYALLLNSDLTTVTPQPSWFTVDNTSISEECYVEIMDPPQPASGTQTQYIIYVYIWDQYNTLTPRNYYISMTIKYNYSPYMNSPAITQDLGSTRIPWPFNYTFWYQNFTDDEGDDINMDCSTSSTTASAGSTAWVNWYADSVTGNITLYGTPPSNNTNVGTVTITCSVDDAYDAPANYYDFTVVVLAKQQVTVTGTTADVSTRLPQIVYVDASGRSIDPEVQAYTRTLKINGTTWDATTFPWITWYEANETIKVAPYSNTQSGKHTILITYDNGIATTTSQTFKITVLQNLPLVALVTLPNLIATVGNDFTFDFNQTAIFSDPEGSPFTMYFRSKGSNTLLYFVYQNYSNGTISGHVSEADIGSYDIECVGVDDALWETAITFTLQVKPCYYKCELCWDADYNTCTFCKTDYYLYNAECVDLCVDGTFADTATGKCTSCPTQCTLCTGSDNTKDCTKCKTGYYSLSGGCYSSCPKGYYGDTTDYKCKSCNFACTACDGPSSSQCLECATVYQVNDIGINTQIGYMLAGKECKIPKCSDGNYFQWTGTSTGACEKCNSRCKKCVGPTENDCTSCYSGYKFDNDEHNCTKCDELQPIGGYFTNEELECEDKCGDGIVITKQCDDGNTINGDGCSSQCTIEYGYACPTAGSPCVENITPTLSITASTSNHLFYLQFSEPITVDSEYDLTSTNIVVTLTTSSGTQISDYSWMVVESSNNQLVPGRDITKFQIKLYDIYTSLEGTETISISFRDYSGIKDLAGNKLTNNSKAESNPASYVYISPSEASAAAGGGTSLKYTFMSVFSFNIALKAVMNGSMQYLWGLVHALQVFNFLLYINIEFPPNIDSFTGYLQVSSGNIDEFNQYIPDLSAWIIDQDDVYGQYDNETLQEKFIDNEIPPYFFIGYGQKLTLWGIAYCIILPVCYVMNKSCKRIKFWENMISSFFWNMPLRTIIEMYIELVLQVLINTQFIKFSNMSQIITSLVALIFGAIALLLPFMTMTLIYHNRRVVRKYKFRTSFGMLTDDLNNKSILQLYYYPAFMYQRLIICALIVYVSDYPLFQCLGVIASNIGMILYLIIVKPFKQENQQTTTVIDEMVIMVCVCLFIYLYKTEMTMDEKKNVGWGIIVLILFSVVKNFGVVIYFGYHQMRKRLREMFSADDECRDSPHTSDGWNSDTVESVATEEIEAEMRQKQDQDEYNELIKKQQQARKNGPGGNSPLNLPGQSASNMMIHIPGQYNLPEENLDIPQFNDEYNDMQDFNIQDNMNMMDYNNMADDNNIGNMGDQYNLDELYNMPGQDENYNGEQFMDNNAIDPNNQSPDMGDQYNEGYYDENYYNENYDYGQEENDQQQDPQLNEGIVENNDPNQQ